MSSTHNRKHTHFILHASLSSPTRREAGLQGGKNYPLIIIITCCILTIANQRNLYTSLRGGEAGYHPRPEEALNLLLPGHELLQRTVVVEAKDQGVELALGHLFTDRREEGDVLTRDSATLPNTEDSIQSQVQMLLISVPVPSHVLAHLLLDGGGLCFSERNGCFVRDARYRVQLCILKSSSNQADGKSVDEEECGDICAG
mmetsp:Transcript_17751/g.24539  ORF Transcript_17751/g.24539 Transcript_17751/m.24539 type:complete len:201 (+) Transcript_17751:108-710(+)